MHKAQKEIREALPKVDLIIELVDARIPFSSNNPMIAELRGDKPTIKILNKTDLADPIITEQWQVHLEKSRNVKTLALTTEHNEKSRQLPALIEKMLPEKAASVNIINAMIMGIPNVGKSTLINTLTGRSAAKTGDEPAVTKGQQKIKLTDDIMLWDTPGMLWPKQEYPLSSYRLATTGAIKDTALDYDDVAFFAADFLLKEYPELLKARYDLTELPDTELEFLETIGRKRGCIGGGGYVDLNRIGKLMITDIRSGSMGPISWENPEAVMKEVAAQDIINEAHEAAKEEKRNKPKKKRKR